MMFSLKSGAKISAATALVLLAYALSWAGMDDVRVVTKLAGNAEVRGHFRRNGQQMKADKWQPLNVGDVVWSDSEVRTGKDARVWLQMGSQIDDVSRVPDDVTIHYEALRPNTRIRLNEEHRVYATHGKMRIFQVIEGKVDLHAERGKVPAARFYKGSH